MGNKIVEINLGNYGSTGTIMRSIAVFSNQCEMEVLQVYPDSPINNEKASNDYIVCSYFFHKVYQKLAYYSGYHDVWNKFNTCRLINTLKRIKPDIIHLHNIHGDFIDIPQLFSYIKKKNVIVVWTLHDCWSFTGRCPHFVLLKCNKWKTGCYDCTYPKNQYPQAKVDCTKRMWALKKKWFTDVKNMTIVTPSKWLAQLTKESFLKNYDVRVINNGINLDVFKPTHSDFRNKYGITKEKHILLGVSFGWGMRKGLDVFVKLASILDDRDYQIVLVGTDEKDDKILPGNIISVHRTQNQKELAEIYTVADLFINPTREENFPTVNIEALACGTPVLTFRTGGSPEIIDETCGSVVDCEDIDTMEQEIKRICSKKPYSVDACLNRAKNFDKNKKFNEYIKLYEEILNEGASY